jgi:hypothetical protein
MIGCEKEGDDRNNNTSSSNKRSEAKANIRFYTDTHNTTVKGRKVPAPKHIYSSPAFVHCFFLFRLCILPFLSMFISRLLPPARKLASPGCVGRVGNSSIN